MFRILTLNLHCYQEENQSVKFSLIAKVIHDFKIDVVLFQEAAQNKNAAQVLKINDVAIREDNAAKIICDQLKELGDEYNFHWDWSHFGWEIWEEGLAILSRNQLRNIKSKYISKSNSKDFWLSRIAISAQIELNEQNIEFVTVHTGFWDDKEESFENQIENLLSLDNTAHAVIFAGDFNVEAGTPGYEYIMKNTSFRDLYLEVNPDGMFDPTIGGVIDGWPEVDGLGKRIDYLFTSSEKLVCKKVNRIFTKENFGEVSDHFGLLAEFELLNFH